MNSSRFKNRRSFTQGRRFFCLGVTMQLTVNGEKREIADSSTVADLLAALQITATRVAVEVNLEIVPKAGYAERTLQDGDTIEIVHFVGGG